MFSKTIESSYDSDYGEDGIKDLFLLEQIVAINQRLSTCAATIHLSSSPNTLTSFTRTQHRTNKVIQVST